MHVSSKYLDLTRKKLELTRLPRELELPKRRWDLGTPKAVLEPLLDYWLESYDWRIEEAGLNTSLPQYRTTISLPSPHNTDSVQKLRIHFVHKRSTHENAIPLLFCHSWPSSFIEPQKVIDALTDPQSLPNFGDGAQQAFHVVVPSIPGFGFSDASTIETFGLEGTAEAFDKVMKRLGYERYVAHGSGWGFSICRTLALNYPQRCVAVHTANPTFAEPTFKQSPISFLKYQLAKVTRARVASLSFGYVPWEVQDASSQDASSHQDHQSTNIYRGPVGPTLSRLYSLRPQTVAFSLCDSPVGLLAGLLDVIHTPAPPSLEPITSRSRSPFLSPIELEQEESHQDRSSIETAFRSTPAGLVERVINSRESEVDSKYYSWSATEVLNWTMMQWLPGPEASLRWLRRAHLDSTPSSPFSTMHCPVPLGISSFRARNPSKNEKATPLMWGSATWNVAWVKRHQRLASLPAWEARDELVLDMRKYFQSHAPAMHAPSSNANAT
ncbi:alpha/beta-hydrolase [Bimuria novae-zelandiae CBS 107.79]|uniref:Alpha/beta-hydrolase n=1 Tax=Bimuria novae-zelandiae CBS 107.79 TaxID=1447943 RepID=A0A6A5UYA1_9PLEO|nr:alpha/beta-hydrolase [Bimuria novae-zelandiae CBS 107.79]